MSGRFEKKDGYMLAIGEGERNNLTEMTEATKSMVAAATELGMTHILADYRKVKYNVPLTDAYNLVKVYETKTPTLKSFTIAGVMNEVDRELIKFWESISNRRGFEFKIFTNIDDALRWLQDKKKHSKATEK